MEEFIGVIVMAIYLVAISAASKNKKKKKEQQRAAKMQAAVQFDQAFGRQMQREPLQDQTAQQLRMEIKGEGEDPCHVEILGGQRASMRMHSASQAQMQAAGEGEDPCHVGQAAMPLEESPVYRSPILDTEESQAFARDVLGGIVMSEVLTRPCQRRASGYTKRGA